MGIDFVVGGPARGEDFFFREEFIDNLWESLKKDNVLLIAPRRMGKTSVMYHLLDHPRNDRLVIHLNVEPLESPAEFFVHLIDAIQEDQPEYFREQLAKTWGFLKKMFQRVKSIEYLELKVALRNESDWKNWQELANQMIERIKRINRPILFIIDEFPDMVLQMQKHSAGEIEPFLHWFRKIRLSPDLTIRWLVGGSTNITATLDQSGHIKLINDFCVLKLPPFTSQEVEPFVRRMLEERGVNFEPDIIPHIKKIMGEPIPFFIQLLTQELYRFWKRSKKQAIKKETVDEVFQKVLLGDQALDKLLHFRSRIDLYYPEIQKEPARDLLNQLSVSEKGITRQTLFALYLKTGSQETMTESEQQEAFNQLLWLLQSDFYIEEVSSDKFDFSNLLLKLWWKKYYGIR